MKPLTPAMVLALADARDARLIGVEATSGGVPGLHPVSFCERHKAQTWNALLDRKLVRAAGERWRGLRYPITDEGMRVAGNVCPPPNLAALRDALAERRGVAVACEDDAYKRLDAARFALRAALDESPATRDAEKLSAQWLEALRAARSAREILDAIPPLSSLDGGAT